MSSTTAILILIGFIAFAIIFRYVFYKICDKGVDTLTNAYREKKNSENEDKTENLSDRYH